MNFCIELLVKVFFEDFGKIQLHDYRHYSEELKEGRLENIGGEHKKAWRENFEVFRKATWENAIEVFFLNCKNNL